MFQFPWYASACLWIQQYGAWLLHHAGSPIRTSPDQSLLTAPRGHFVVRHVLRRLLAPRHPPCALSSLTYVLMLCAVHSIEPLRSLSSRVQVRASKAAHITNHSPVAKSKQLRFARNDVSSHLLILQRIFRRKMSCKTAVSLSSFQGTIPLSRAEDNLSTVPSTTATSKCCQPFRLLLKIFEGRLHLQN